MAVAWVLRHPGLTSALVGASQIGQIEEVVASLSNLNFTDAELGAINNRQLLPRC